ncbi:MAG: dockerin type I domain-containing protein, partial [Pirellulales bacterium]
LIGGASFYFGIEGPTPAQFAQFAPSQPGATAYTSNPDILNTYGLPGGAYGSVTSNTFSLAGYSAFDLPTLYFNYLLDTNDVDSTSNTALDAMRVMVSADGVNWQLLATSNAVPGSGGAENPPVITPNGGGYNGGTSQQKVQGLWESDETIATDSTLKVWRQARVDLADFAGQSNLRLRFQFSTAGTMGSGSSTTGTGRTLQALAGSQLRDGQSFTIDTTPFTFRSGIALNVPAGGGAVIPDGTTLVVNGTTFEFDKLGGVSGTNIAIPISDQQTAEQVAQSISVRLAAPPLSLVTRLFGSRIELPGATTVSSPGGFITVQGVPLPAVPAPTDVIINGNMSSTQVAAAMAAAIDRVFAAVDNPAIFTTAKLSGDQLRIFGHTIAFTGPLPSFSGTLPGDNFAQFNNTTRDRHKGLPDNLPAEPPPGFVPKLEGIYIDDFTIGLASRGEMVTNALPAAVDFTTIPSIPGAPTRILTGPYQLKIGPTDNSASTPVDPQGHIDLLRSFNVNDRFARGFTLTAPPASQVVDGQTFTIDDGYTALVFEFNTNVTFNAGNRPVAVENGASAAVVATRIRDAINLAFGNQLTKVRASTVGNRVDLFDAIEVVSSGLLGVLVFGAAGGQTTTGMGDVNGVFGQHQVSSAAGQTIIQNNSVSDSRQVGIQVIPLIGQIRETGIAFTVLSTFPVGRPGFTGGIANLPVPNTRGWMPGVTVKNNLVVASGRTGIQVGGDPNASYAYAQAGDREANYFREFELFLPFVRVVNNTVYDAKNGIAASNVSSPTIVNNIIANSGVTPTAVIQTRGAAIYVDDSSGGAKSLPQGLAGRFGDTVVAANLYQNNAFNVLGTSDSNAIALLANEPLFVDPSKRNFYLAEDSRAIDSSVNSVQERSALFSTTGALGIPPLPIQAPETDLLGQLRVDDPSVPTPPGLGSNIFKDRGALERADFIGPTAALVNPIDNDPAGLDRNQQANRVVLVNRQLTDFRIQLLDGVGVGIDDSTVDISKFVITRTIGTTTTPLTPNFDYVMAYDTNSKIVRFIPAQGIWINGTYTISLDNVNNSADPIKDLADNALQANEPPATQFVIQLTDSIVSPWQNPINRFDVNADGIVAGLDLLLIINRILAGQTGPLPLVAVVPPYIDVSGDGSLSLVDAINVINHILANTPPPPGPPGAPLTTTSTTLAGDAPGAS